MPMQPPGVPEPSVEDSGGVPVRIRFVGEVQPEAVDEVREAIELERRAARRSLRVEITEVVQLSEGEPLYRLEVQTERPLEGAERWRGAELRRPLGAFPDVPGALNADIIEVDAKHRRLYVEAHLDSVVIPGPAYIHPFDFLRAPSAVLNDPRMQPLLGRLTQHLAAARGSLLAEAADPDRDLGPWNSGWGIVWGPPGTGKTHTLGERVAQLLDDPSERILVLSTTHKAADEAALQLGEHATRRGVDLRRLKRVARTTRHQAFRDAGLTAMLPVPDPLALELHRLEEQLQHTVDPGVRARLRRRIRALQASVPGLKDLVWDPWPRALVATLHAGLGMVPWAEVADALVAGRAPFTTVVLDEAGLIPSASAATAALLAARRVVLIGDAKQLSPIAQAARSRPPSVMRWIARSPLDHLRSDRPSPHVHRLETQYRMHPDIRAGVSALQYGNALKDAEQVLNRPWCPSGLEGLRDRRRLLWIPADRVPGIRASEAQSERGPSGSRQRPASLRILDALLSCFPALAQESVLFISPFRAQADAITAWARARSTRWTASTVHAQQGAQAEVVVFDTVHASSTTWDAAEWRRLVNVGLSRAREVAILIATETELAQHWIRPLLPHLSAVTPGRGDLRRIETRITQTEMFSLQRGVLHAQPEGDTAETPTDPDRLGAQIRARRALRSVLSREQHRLVHRDLSDAGPRLVRGVAGSGKTLVLARWAAHAVHRLGLDEVVIVYANAALRPILEHLLAEAWGELTHGRPLPVEAFILRHVDALLDDLRRERGLPAPGARFDYEARARAILDSGPSSPRFPAILVDEAQDLGHAPLELLVQLAEPRDGQRAVMVFYDNAQNIYGRQTPNWKQLGLDMRGRSDVMRESFRTTRPILELAHFLCDQIEPLEKQPEIRELLRLGLLHRSASGDRTAWRVNYCGVDGQVPELSLFATATAERAGITKRVRQWIEEENVDADDIRIIVCRREDGPPIADALEQAGIPASYAASTALAERVLHRTGRVLVSTAASFKGYDAEIVIVARTDGFVGRQGVYTATLYVALTRARTHLWVTGAADGDARLVGALRAAGAVSRG